MSHREEFEKALDDYADAVAANNDFGGPDSPKVEQDAKAEVLRLFDEKREAETKDAMDFALGHVLAVTFTESDLEAVAREAAKGMRMGLSETGLNALAAEVVTRYLQGRDSQPTGEK